MDIFTAIRRRRSIREFTGEEIPPEDIEKILDAARYAPSPENMQMVRYIVIREDKDFKRFMADLCQEAAQELFGMYPYELAQGRLWYIPEEKRPSIFKRMRDGTLFRYPEKADTIVIGFSSEVFQDSPLIYPHELFGSVVIGMAFQNMWLAATALGYGVGYQAFPAMDPRRAEVVCEALGVPRSWKPIGALHIGVPKRPRMAGPSRFPMEGMFYAERWGNPYIRLAFRGRRW